jgi:flagellar hook-associated protein 3 FlgL
MRLTFNSFSDSLLPRLQNLGNAQNTALNQLSSGQRISVASDDPAAMGRVLNMRAEKAQQQQFWNNSNRALSISQASFSALSQLNKASTRASELAVAGGSDTTPAASLTTYGVEVNQLIETALAAANSKLQGSYLLAGTATDAAPFTVTRNATGQIDAVTYAGASDNGAAFRIGETETFSPSTTEAENRQVAAFLNNLVSLRDGLQSGSPASVKAVRPALNSSEDALLAGLSRSGGVQYRLEVSTSDAASRFQMLQESISKEADVDFAQASIRLSRTQTAYQAAIQSAAKIMDTSLLDYLR